MKNSYHQFITGMTLSLLLIILSTASSLWAAGSITGYGRFEKITGNPAMGYKGLYEWDLFLSPGDNSLIGPFRRLGAPPGGPNTDDGYYRIDNLPAGVYSVYVNQPDFFASPKLVPEVVINNNQTTTLNVELDVDYSTYFRDTANEQWTPWEWDWYQTYTAVGTAVRGVSWVMAGLGGNKAKVRILEDNGSADVRNWKQVGYNETGNLGGNTDCWVRWFSGLVPMTPGKQYAVNIHIDGGMAIYKRNKDSQSYKNGQAYNQNGDAQNFDLCITVFADRNSQEVTHTRISSGPGSFNGSNEGTRWSQSFVAKGTALAAADVFAASNRSDFNLTWKIRKDGPNGPQLGPTKRTYGAYYAANTDLVGVSYNPGEIPLVPGQTYYIEVNDTTNFTPYHQESWNAYSDGQAYKNGSATGYDLAMTIMEYNFPKPPRSTDLNGDDRIDFFDVAVLGNQWLDRGSELIADINADDIVDTADFSIVHFYWLWSQAANLAGHWPLNENRGTTVYDISLAIRNGHLIGDSQWQTFGGKIKGALQLDGAGDFARIDAYKGITGSGPRTCALWIKTAAPGTLLSWGRSELGRKWIPVIHTNGVLRLGVWGGYINGTQDLRDDQWHHVAVVMEQGVTDVKDVKLYVDGQPEAISASAPRLIDTGSGDDLTFGAYYDAAAGYDGFFNGLLDDIRIYHRDLPPAEIEALYNLGGAG